jgi:hypothetical protein
VTPWLQVRLRGVTQAGDVTGLLRAWSAGDAEALNSWRRSYTGSFEASLDVCSRVSVSRSAGNPRTSYRSPTSVCSIGTQCPG